MEEKLISVVLPCYNEAGNIHAVYEALSAVFAPFAGKYEFELMFVDDGSKDATAAELAELHEKDPVRVQYLMFSRNFGKERAVLAGLDNARGDAVIIMDADLQHPVSAIPEMLAGFEAGYDDVYGLKTDRGEESALKKLLTKVFYGYLSKNTGDLLVPNVGDFRLLSRRAVDAFCRFREANRYNKGYFALIGFKKKALPYRVEERKCGETKWSAWQLFRFAMDGLTGFSTFPLRLSTILGFFIAVLSFLFGVVEILVTLLQGSVPGYPSLLASITFLGGLQLLSIGVMGEYIGRIYRENQNRPLYIVQESTLGGQTHDKD